MPIITDNIILLFGMPRSKLTCLHGQPLIDSFSTNLIGCLIIYEGMLVDTTKPTQQLVIVGWFGLKQLILFLISFGCCEPTT